MALSLPGNRLIYLSRDNLNPESFERIISPYAAWQHAEKDYRYDDRWYHSRYIVNIDLKSDGPYSSATSQHGSQAKAQLERMIQRGEVVCLNDVSVLPASLFYIDDNGALICRDKTAFLFDGTRRVIKEFNLAVSRRDYRHSGGKPAPTSSRQLRIGDSQPVTCGTLNSKNVGRLLATGGIYNGNVEGFRQAAEQLGGDAPAGYEQVMSNKGLLITGASIAAGLAMGRINPVSEIKALDELNSLRPATEKIGSFSVSELSNSAGIIDKPPLTKSGRALQKHGDRIGSVFPKATGDAIAKNAQGQSIVDSILNDPNKTVILKNTGRFGQVIDITSSKGQGLRYDSNGNLIGFLEPPK